MGGGLCVCVSVCVQVKNTGGSIGGVGTQVDQDGQSEWQGPSSTAILNILNSASLPDKVPIDWYLTKPTPNINICKQKKHHAGIGAFHLYTS